jgi:hypothetical protein
MKKRVLSQLHFIAFAALLSLGLGFPGQAKAEPEGDCQERTRTIERGDSNWQISREFYGTSQFAHQIAERNWDTSVKYYHKRGPDVDAGLVDANFIPASWGGHRVVFYIPCVVRKPTLPSSSRPAPAPRPETTLRSFTPAPTREQILAVVSDVPAAPRVASTADMTLLLPEVVLPLVTLEEPSPEVERSPITTAATIKQPETPVSKPAVPARSNPSSVRSNHKGYEVTVLISPQLAQDYNLASGTFAALFLQDQTPDGEWKKKRSMTVVIQSDARGYLCNLILKEKPPKNAEVLIDLEHGNALRIAGDLLIKGDASEKEPPLPFEKKSYAALNHTVRIHPGKFFGTMRLAAPVLIHTGVAFALGGPIGLATVPATFVSSIATRKINKNHEKMEALRHPSLNVENVLTGLSDDLMAQHNDLDALKQKVQQLEQQLNSYEQNPTIQNKGQPEVAQ